MSYYGTRLRYVGIQVNLSLSTQELSYLVGLPVRDTWEKFLDDQVPSLPPNPQSHLLFSFFSTILRLFFLTLLLWVACCTERTVY